MSAASTSTSTFQEKFNQQKAVQLTDHLGNVRATVKKNGSAAEITTRADYYAFGGKMEGYRSFYDANGAYRFNYQGQEGAQAGTDPNRWTNFELRMFNPDLGRWMAPDPYGQFHSPYVGMGNNPISGVDPDGGYVNIGGGGSSSGGGSSLATPSSIRRYWDAYSKAYDEIWAKYNPKSYYNGGIIYGSPTNSYVPNSWEQGREIDALNAQYGRGLSTGEMETIEDILDRPSRIRTGIYYGDVSFLGAYADGGLDMGFEARFDGNYAGRFDTYGEAVQHITGLATNWIKQEIQDKMLAIRVNYAEMGRYNSDGLLAQAGGGPPGEKGGGDRNLSDPKQYPGISIYQNNDKRDMTAVTLPGFGIYIGGGYNNRSLTRVMQHEYGHYLDYRFSSDINFSGQIPIVNFYLKIGIPSLFNAATGIGGSHSSYWTETRANRLAKIWFGKNLDPDFLKLYPIK